MVKIDDTLEISCLIEALRNLNEATEAERKARDEYDGPSWGYYGHHVIETKEKAEQEFKERLDAYIDARIRAVQTVS